ncbi:3-(3-hydroxy-phenyl)propionate transporter MhpT [Acinetobacter cumulans]|jgi:AAHS family 3-hydroxyphenylpropionic acid transporter|uniref:3-(3-hydroxy-phenyl)propionate transporter MhpT n=1 Tax=Acinetobacter cumulans TaxID=2136182 RepID=A0A3A8G0P8_9GAMM|nr:MULTISPECIES: 3-(3-hydroxy-phenyl)propionate transporter MhpT [Acinetobacter]RFS36070.1 3-(3-hydroxy-phenyl)propionate transporter MhpT [Acinetobacter sp. SWAC5]RKG48504.1 3-(3-hydroxy-phenyl)propionate transporter MhpT [Acinetobacter cumulans]RLL34877.1 3-(3-hydroxy-phenyl)propionate transporter MhpT [Acinetobacter cumulans]RLL39824.1 3-(3-hydroxy-phenyl)propionate transporter MhpT [Acinetobacter cumulans]
MEQQQNTQRNAVMTILICFLIALIEGIDLQSAGVAAAGVSAHFGLDKSSLGLFFSAAILGLLPGGLIGGRLGDRIGRKKVLIIAVALFGLFSILTAWVTSYSGLLFARFMTGLGLGAALPNLVALASESVSDKARGRAISLMYCGMPIGGIAVSLLASTQLAADWKVIFYVGGVLPLMVIPLMMAFLPESRAFLATQQSADTAQQSKFSDLFNQYFRMPTILLWVGYFFTMMVVYMLLNWLPSLLMELGFQKKDATMVQMFFSVGAFVGTIVLGLLVDHWKMKNVILLMYSGIILGLIALNSFSTVNAMYFAGALVGCFTIGGQMVLYALGSQVYPTQMRGTGVGTAMTVGRFGAMAGPAVAGQFLAMGNGATGLIATCIPGIIIAAVLILILLGTMQKRAQVQA